ncbi:MAG: hypothetical protein KME42_01235 [Tildeniella nuda ZEHNDER 1965/U140]|jgi:hypothetical protein|nr:hypothetical protein [Tildeniella nuda ZEHNDER 1965/U140]
MSSFSYKLFQCSLVVLATSSVGIAIAPLTTNAQPSGAVAIAAQPTVDVPFEVCGEAQTWVRPTKADQTKKLRSLPRYGGDLTTQPLKGLSQRFWQQEVFSFTQYGLSLRMEPIYLSGLWTVQETLWKCYNAKNVTQINAGKTAEVWVLSHRVTRIKWTGEQYVMVVQPAQTGVQFIQFPRREARSSLPLKVVTETGAKLTVVAGN